MPNGFSAPGQDKNAMNSDKMNEQPMLVPPAYDKDVNKSAQISGDRSL